MAFLNDDISMENLKEDSPSCHKAICQKTKDLVQKQNEKLEKILKLTEKSFKHK